MNLLSVVSIIIYTSFFIGAFFVKRAQRKSIMNITGSAVLLNLGWWSFCNSFFFSATTASQAMFWHKLSAIGWCGFVVCTAYYFLALTKYNKKLNTWWKKFLFFLPTIILIFKNVFGNTTSLAQKIIPSTSGWGWTYQNSITSIWLWLYLIYVIIYFGFAFYLLYHWAQSVKHKMKKEMAYKFIILDTFTIMFGVVSDVLCPLTNHSIPAIASIITVIFGIGYFIIIYRYDLFNINLVISSDAILEASNNLLFVLDENNEILKYNKAVTNLLGYQGNELIGRDFIDLIKTKIELDQFYNKDLINIETEMKCKDGETKDILVSASIAKDKQGSFLCFTVSCQDVSKQMEMQEELILERKKIEKLANEYQKLSYYDLLTGLSNRRRFYEILELYENQFRQDNFDFAIIFMDLDNFKQVNDVYGHKGGDEILRATANKLMVCIEANEFVARLGGDEFIILMANENKTSVSQKVKKIEDEFHKKITFQHQPYEILISYGTSVFSKHKNLQDLMEEADKAMYENKRGKGLISNDSFMKEEPLK
ncbi:MAG: diguanylate cyclase [Erysipelotrichaceae bacterium]